MDTDNVMITSLSLWVITNGLKVQHILLKSGKFDIAITVLKKSSVNK